MIKKLVVYGVTDKFLKYIESWGFRYDYNYHRDIITVYNMPGKYYQEFNAPAGVWMEAIL